MNMVFECWRPVRGYTGLYLVSDLGRVKNQKTGRLLKIKTKKNGYQEVSLAKDRKMRTFLLHKVVWEAFKYDRPKGWHIDHLDFDRTNNCIYNLLVRPAATNIARRSEEGKRIRIETNKKRWSKKTLQFSLDGSFIKEWPSAAEIERQTGFCCVAIQNNCRGITKSSCGYIWRYA